MKHTLLFALLLAGTLPALAGYNPRIITVTANPNAIAQGSHQGVVLTATFANDPGPYTHVEFGVNGKVPHPTQTILAIPTGTQTQPFYLYEEPAGVVKGYAKIGIASIECDIAIVSVTLDTLEPNPVAVSGRATAKATVTPSTRTLTWEFVNNDIGVAFALPGGGTGPTCTGTTATIVAGNTPGTVTVKVSDQSTGAAAERTLTVGQIYLTCQAPVPVNDGDADNDGFPGFADGFNQFAGTSNRDTAPPLVALGLEIKPDGLDLTGAQLTFAYTAADPAGTTPQGTDPKLYYQPAAGLLRLWKVADPDNAANREQRNPASVASGGNWVPTTALNVDLILGTGKNVTLLLEGIRPGTDTLTVSLKLATSDVPLSGQIQLKVVKADLDVDSDNQNAIDISEFNFQDQIEDRQDSQDAAKFPGKYVAVNDGDQDNDGVPNWADGFESKDSGDAPNSGANAGGSFTEMTLAVPEPVDLSKAKLRFTYSASDPYQVSRPGKAAPYVYTPADGNLRIWIKDGNVSRSAKSIAEAGGHYVPPNAAFAADKLGLAAAGRTVPLYVEGIRPSDNLADQQIKVELNPDGDGDAGWVHGDALRLTIVRIDIRTARIADAQEETRRFNIFLNEDFDQELAPQGDPVRYATDISDETLAGEDMRQIGRVICDAVPAAAQPMVAFMAPKTRLFLKDRRTVAVADTWYPLAQVNGTLYVEGLDAGLTSITARARFGTEAATFSDTIAVRVVRLNLAAVTITPEGDADANETSTRDLALRCNDDDDNGNQVADRKEDTAVAGENDLFQITLDKPNLPQEEVSGGGVTLTVPGRLRAWEDAAKTTPAKEAYSIDALPKPLFLEGLRPSGGSLDQHVRVAMTLDSDVQCNDELRLTVFRLELDRCPYGWEPRSTRRGGRGSTVGFDAQLVPGIAADEVALELRNVSQEPGFCLNGHNAAGHNADNDLQFEAALNSDLDEVNELDVIKRDADTIRGTVSCFDYGAFGEIHAHARIGRYTCTAAVQESDNDIFEYATIPRDEDNPRNGIPDSSDWNRTRHPVTKAWTTGATDDFDQNPDSPLLPANQRYGDGFSRYEEWRGFLVFNDIYKRLPLDKKDIFVHDPNSIKLGFFRASGLNLRVIEAKHFNGIANRVVNFNRGSHSKGEQHGLYVIADNARGQGFGWAESIPGGTNGPPGNKRIIHVYVDEILATFGRDHTNAVFEPIDRYKIAHTAAHECAHGASIWHHDDAAPGNGPLCLMRYVDTVLVNGAVLPDSMPQDYCEDDTGCAAGRGQCALRFCVDDNP